MNMQNHREDKFLRATNYRYYGSEEASSKCDTQSSSKKSSKTKKSKVLSVAVSVIIAAAIFVIPTTTLAPGVDAFEDARAASLSVGNIDEFSLVITDNCVVPTTSPATQYATTVAPTTVKATEPTEATQKVTEVEKAESKKVVVEPAEDVNYTQTTESSKTEYEPKEESTQAQTENSKNEESSYNGSYLLSVSKPDKSYNPQKVTLSEYDRAKLERLVMGEAGSMGYTGCTLVAQSIRDAMNRSNTTSIDRIISEYQYYAPTTKAPNSDVKNAVSYIFDQNGSAVQHRILCFNAGGGSWHDTQNYIVSCGNVKFYDLWY